MFPDWVVPFYVVLERHLQKFRIIVCVFVNFVFYFFFAILCNLVIFSERELTFTFAIISSSVRPSVRLSVTFVRPTQAIEIFGNVSTPFGMLAIC